MTYVYNGCYIISLKIIIITSIFYYKYYYKKYYTLTVIYKKGLYSKLFSPLLLND
jgi:hypothetical protein